jgi:5-deoxy-glucuronate isomerase
MGGKVMRFDRLGAELKQGYNPMATRESDMLMDIGYQVINQDTAVELSDPWQEMALVIVTGNVMVRWNGREAIMKRQSLFEENPYCLHVPAGMQVIIKTIEKSEVLVQKTINNRKFAPVFYQPQDIQTNVFGAGLWEGTAKRTVRTIFDYANAPYSNMVNGEVVNAPGRWSGYIPHVHPQPEVYAYKFSRPQGFGACFIGDNVFKITHNSWAELSGGYCHPQVAAPGYAMWYSWMIRHLEGNPWQKTRTDLPEHVWLLPSGRK